MNSPARTPPAAAGTLLIALLLSLLAPFGAAKAHAVDQNDDVSWHLNDGKPAYRGVIDEVRAGAESRVLYGSRAATTRGSASWSAPTTSTSRATWSPAPARTTTSTTRR